MNLKPFKTKGEPVLELLENITMILTAECQIQFTLCSETIGYQTSLVKYKLYKGSIKLNEGSMDACAKTKNADKKFKKVLTAMEWPIGCPVEAVCIIILLIA